MRKHKIAALFAGCGGLDLGFSQAGFKIVWANEFDKSIWETYKLNHPKVKLDKRSILDVASEEIPDVDGIIGGPPCQSWSLAGAMRGEEDPRGQVFWEYVRILKDKQPMFFLAENVAGIVSRAHKESFDKLLHEFERIGYKVKYELLDTKHYGVPQERKRVIIVGYAKEIGKRFDFPGKTHVEKDKMQNHLFTERRQHEGLATLRDAIGDLPEPMPAKEFNKSNGNFLEIPNHEYMIGGFSTIYMSRNRVRGWDEQSFTIQAGGRHAPCHPHSNKMIFVEKDIRIFDPGSPKPYRRLSVRECARIQTFPDSFVFKYEGLSDAYKMVGNAVPVKLARILAEKIMVDLRKVGKKKH